MTTYETINEAFKNGTGDVIFTKAGRYLAASRKVDNSGLIAAGFTQMPFLESYAIAKAEKGAPVVISCDINRSEPSRTVIFVHQAPPAPQIITPYFGANGPTGHGDICFSDADPGL